MPNIKFWYLYRDSGNYKNHGYVVFANPLENRLEEMETRIRLKLIDEQWFYAPEWGLPDLFTTTFNPYDDPAWHEFDYLEFTSESANYSLPFS